MQEKKTERKNLAHHATRSMDSIEKFLGKLQKKYRMRAIDTIDAILANRLNGLDIKPVKGKKNWFRCRIGDIRIVFIRTRPGINVIYDIRFRGKAYRDI